MKHTIAALAIAIVLSACSSSKDATRALRGAGYTDIQTHGYAFFACGEGDSFATKFTATGPSGNQVSGAVCSAWFKGSTIRLD